MILLLILFFSVSNSKILEASTSCSKIEFFISFVADSLKLPSHLKISEPEKHYWPYVMARLEKYNSDDASASRLVRLFAVNKSICYSVPGIVRLIYNYPDSPAVRKNTQLFIKKAFERNDSYNIWTGEGTESQISMSRTSGYLLAQKALVYGNYFGSAQEKLTEMKNWILDWSARIYQVGTAEYNSSVSVVYNIIGWLNLYDFAEDNDVRLAAKAVLDYYSTEMALHYNSGFVGGAEMRGTSIADHSKTASFFYNWFWFSPEEDEVSFAGNDFLQLIFAATSEYKPPALLVKYVQSIVEEPEFYLNSKPSYLLSEPSFNKQMYYRNSNYTLGCQYSPYGGWTKNSSRIVNWKLLVNSSNKVSEIRGNGVYWNNYSGLGRDPWTQWGQYENILIQLNKVPENARDQYKKIDEQCKIWNNHWKKDLKRRFKNDKVKKNIYVSNKNHRFVNESYILFPDYVEFSDTDGIWFVNFGDVYMAIVGVPTYQPTFLRDRGDKKLLVISNAPGKVCGFVIELSNASDYASYDEFKEIFIRQHIMYLNPELGLLTYESPEGKHIEFLFQDEGKFQEPIFDWGFGLTEPMVNQHMTDFKQPQWAEFNGSGRVPLLLAENFRYQFDQPWPVFSGPSINLDQSVLDIDFAGETYRVDYSKRIPVFYE